VAVPTAQHFNDSFGFFAQVKDAVGAFEGRELLHFGVSGAPQVVTAADNARVAERADRFGREIVRVLFAAPGFTPPAPVGDDFLEITPGASGEDYSEPPGGHRSRTFAMNSSAL